MKTRFARRLGIVPAPAPTPAPSEPPIAPPEAGYIHPGRYPRHTDPLKGQLYGGECNTTRCTENGAVIWNACTYGLYCRTCARGINFRPGEEICVRVRAKPDRTEMDRLQSETMSRVSSARAARATR